MFKNSVPFIVSIKKQNPTTFLNTFPYKNATVRLSCY